MSALDYRDGLRPYAESSCRTGLDDLPDETYVVPTPYVPGPLPPRPAPPAFVYEQAPSRMSILDPSRAPPPTQAPFPIWTSTFRFPTPPPAPSPPRQPSPPPAPAPARKAARSSARKPARASAPKHARPSARSSARKVAPPPPSNPKLVLHLPNFAFDSAQLTPAETCPLPPMAPAPASKNAAPASQAPAPVPKEPTRRSGRIRAAVRKPISIVTPPPVKISTPPARITSTPARYASPAATKKGSAKAIGRSTKATHSKNAPTRSIAPLPARARKTAAAPARTTVPAREIAPLPARARSTRSNSAASASSARTTRSSASSATLVPSRASSKSKERAVSPILEDDEDDEAEETDCEESDEGDEEEPESCVEGKKKGGRQLKQAEYDDTTPEAKKIIEDTAETLEKANGSEYGVHAIVAGEMMARFRREQRERTKRQRLNAEQGTAKKSPPLDLEARIERHRTDEMVKSFAAHTVVCAACDTPVGTDFDHEAYYAAWNKHKFEKCKAILAWEDYPPSQETMKEWQRARNKCADGMLKVYPDALEKFGGDCVCKQLGLEKERREAVAAQRAKRAEARAAASA
ncbi:uncharacterized protein SCHCODRAFT_02505983 [Schizophyllum commune H4-8]|uniref:Uncharacterized protein n=1 Tax=Schizophyllum commune (strain H4-8 / FGSC 9210) TaxID=578458 RepID=D8Q6A2_SCHCM|nr:uncharacterized protein SCHCODRAFT_02505983 [Schizophyllum commune H4-8]KAI5891037.1 hypothetical protein SCHCODRAFT_02505983 [Schizophyllum commune H4-8]